jgi:hypothetical protein
VDRSVERQLAEEHDLGNMPALDGTGRRQDAERDREIERGAGLADIGRREVDGDPVRRELEPRVADRAADTIAALAHTRVGQAHHREHRHAEGHVDLRRAPGRPRRRRQQPFEDTRARPADLQASSQKSSPNRFNDLESSTAPGSQEVRCRRAIKAQKAPNQAIDAVMLAARFFTALLNCLAGSQRTCWTPSRI